MLKKIEEGGLTREEKQKLALAVILILLITEVLTTALCAIDKRHDDVLYIYQH